MAEITLCSIPECGKPRANKRGWCGKHYYRWRVHGDPYKTRKAANGEAAEYFYSTVMSHTGDDCLIWPFSHDNHGYGGYVTVNGKRYRPHVLSCIETHGPRPSPEYEAAHSCGKGHKGCIAPEHVSWKTRQENQQDRRIHGTYQNGALNPTAKLTEDQVATIRTMKGKMLQREIAKIFSISRENVSAIHTNKSWS
jgi:hypothetical protein